jgi:hypothetical protein
VREGIENKNGDCVLMKGCTLLWLLCDSGLDILELRILEFEYMSVAERVP